LNFSIFQHGQALGIPRGVVHLFNIHNSVELKLLTIITPAIMGIATSTKLPE
jgi:hypothetical protein